jgi:hypothetical protein
VILDRLRTQNYYINSVHGDWPTANLKLGAPLLRTFCSQWLFAAISEILYRRSDFVSGKFNDLYKVKLTPGLDFNQKRGRKRRDHSEPFFESDKD